jgi:hypothetical protein
MPFKAQVRPRTQGVVGLTVGGQRHFKGREGHPMHYVYVLQSQANPRKTYVGMTHDVAQRLKKHNRAAPRTRQSIPLGN